MPSAAALSLAVLQSSAQLVLDSTIFWGVFVLPERRSSLVAFCCRSLKGCFVATDGARNSCPGVNPQLEAGGGELVMRNGDELRTNWRS